MLAAISTRLVVKRTLLEANQARSAGGAMAMLGCADASLDDNNIHTNMAVSGGGLFAQRSTVLVQATKLHNNRAAGLISNLAGAAAGVVGLVGQGGATIFVHSSVCASNSSLVGNVAAMQAGAMLLVHPHNFTIVKTRFERNVARQGAGGAVLVSSELDSVIPGALEGCRFAFNKASSRGGAMYVDARAAPVLMSCIGCKFEHNTAKVRAVWILCAFAVLQ